MLRIWKYKLRIVDIFILDLPKSAKILSVMKQDNEPVLYALIDDTEQKTTPHKLRIIGTGHPFAHSMEYDYLGSVSTYNDTYVWHIFDKKHTET